MSWPYNEYEPQIMYLPSSNSWLCKVRKLNTGNPQESSFRSMEGPNPPIHVTPNDALQAAVDRISSLENSRQEVLAVEALNRLIEDKPRLRSVMVPNPDKGPKIKMWEALKDDGTWTEPQATVYGAMKMAIKKSSSSRLIDFP